MWFGKKQSTRNEKRRQGPPEPGKRSRPVPAIPKAAWIPIAGIVAVALTAYIIWLIGALLFWENPQFSIKTISITLEGSMITRTEIHNNIGVKEGQNLFSFNIRKMANAFLKATPLAKSILIHRQLPDTLVIKVQERIPVAKIGRGSALAADIDGHTFKLRANNRDFPIISGCAETNLHPGIEVDQAVKNAILAIDVCRQTRGSDMIRVASADVSAKDSIELYLAAGERVKVGWKDMSKVTDANIKELHDQISRLATAMRASEERGKKIVNLDLTYGGQYVPAQEY